MWHLPFHGYISWISLRTCYWSRWWCGKPGWCPFCKQLGISKCTRSIPFCVDVRCWSQKGDCRGFRIEARARNWIWWFSQLHVLDKKNVGCVPKNMGFLDIPRMQGNKSLRSQSLVTIKKEGDQTFSQDLESWIRLSTLLSGCVDDDHWIRWFV